MEDGLATLEVPETFRYLGPEDSKLEFSKTFGGNPPRPLTLGMLFPADVSPAQKEGWGVIVTYEEDGYVEDDEAADLDYDDLLAEMKQDTLDANEQRTEMGYEPIELVGWAEEAALRCRLAQALLGEGPPVWRPRRAHTQLQHPRARPPWGAGAQRRRRRRRSSVRFAKAWPT